MAQYRVLQKSFIDNRIVEEGEVIEYEGEVSDNLELIEQPKPKRAKADNPAPDASDSGLV